jgi:putative transposase
MTKGAAGSKPSEVATQPPVSTVSDEQLMRCSSSGARGKGLQLSGEGGLLQQLTKRVLESALDGEGPSPEVRTL